MSSVGDNILAVLAGRIREAHEACRAAAVVTAERAIEAGRLLIEAKAAVRHGEWLSWLRDHTGISERTAQRYMRLAQLGLKPDTVSDLGIAAALAAAARKRPRAEISRVPLPGEGQVVIALAGREAAHLGREHVAFLWPAAEHPGFLHHLLFWSPPDMANGEQATGRRPVRADAMHEYLAVSGFPVHDAAFAVLDGYDVAHLEDWRRGLLAGGDAS